MKIARILFSVAVATCRSTAHSQDYPSPPHQYTSPVPGARQGQLRPHFQIFTSGIALRKTFLIDTDTGVTWMLVTGKQKLADGTEGEYRAWEPFGD